VPEVDRLLFSHNQHVKANLLCISCHEGNWDAVDLKTRLLPNEDKCLECHKEAKAEKKCGLCHSDVQFAAPWPAQRVRFNFNHAKHLELTQEKCDTCHLQLYEPGFDAPITAGHIACTKCHEHEEHIQRAQCSKCHLDLKTYPLRPIVEYSHQGNYLARHGFAARATSNSCANCHEQRFCLDCHGATTQAPLNLLQADRPDRSFVHRGDFLSRHPVEARADEASCKQCHSPNTCVTCHQQQHVAPVGAGGRSPHPPAYALPGGGPIFHGDEARRDISSCAACHDQGAKTNCIACHKVGSIGGNPHPLGYSTNHTLSEAAKNPMCRNCH
jgi:hypothetical protein